MKVSADLLAASNPENWISLVMLTLFVIASIVVSICSFVMDVSLTRRGTSISPRPVRVKKLSTCRVMQWYLPLTVVSTPATGILKVKRALIVGRISFATLRFIQPLFVAVVVVIVVLLVMLPSSERGVFLYIFSPATIDIVNSNPISRVAHSWHITYLALRTCSLKYQGLLPWNLN